MLINAEAVRRNPTCQGVPTRRGGIQHLHAPYRSCACWQRPARPNLSNEHQSPTAVSKSTGISSKCGALSEIAAPSDDDTSPRRCTAYPNTVSVARERDSMELRLVVFGGGVGGVGGEGGWARETHRRGDRGMGAFGRVGVGRVLGWGGQSRRTAAIVVTNGWPGRAS